MMSKMKRPELYVIFDSTRADIRPVVLSVLEVSTRRMADEAAAYVRLRARAASRAA